MGYPIFLKDFKNGMIIQIEYHDIVFSIAKFLAKLFYV